MPVISGPEDGGTYAYLAATTGNSDFEIVGHTHGQCVHGGKLLLQCGENLLQTQKTLPEYGIIGRILGDGHQTA